MGLILFPDPVLRKKAAVVTDFKEPQLAAVIIELRKLIRTQKHGIGAAAPQVGFSLQLAIVDISRRQPDSKEIILINPEIRERKGEILNREGCMSLPDYRANVLRHQEISLSWHDLSGVKRTAEFKGIEAICIQHEVDHLSGLLFIDRVVSLKRDLMPRRRGE